MATVRIIPATLQGAVQVPSSKSMGHRNIICAGLSGGGLTEDQDVAAALDHAFARLEAALPPAVIPEIGVVGFGIRDACLEVSRVTTALILKLNNHQLKLVGLNQRTESPAIDRQASQPVAQPRSCHWGLAQNDVQGTPGSFLW